MPNIKYYSLTIEYPLLNLEIKLAKCSQCWAKKLVLVYRQPIRAVIQDNQLDIGKEILLCLNCLTEAFKAAKKEVNNA